jgi:hypothetical protein
VDRQLKQYKTDDIALRSWCGSKNYNTKFENKGSDQRKPTFLKWDCQRLRAGMKKNYSEVIKDRYIDDHASEPFWSSRVLLAGLGMRTAKKKWC